MTKLYHTSIDTPLGELFAATTDRGVCFLNYIDSPKFENTKSHIIKALSATLSDLKHPILEKLRCQIDEYFAAKRTDFDIPIQLIGTNFQCSVWSELCNTPYGLTRSYQDQTTALGRPKSVRAVANANGANTIIIVVPCHRIISSSGKLAGYSSGLWRKERLLQLEGVI